MDVVISSLLSIAAISGAFLIKMASVSLLARHFRVWGGDEAGHWLAAWVLTTGFQIAAMMVASAFEALGIAFIWTWQLGCLAILYWRSSVPRWSWPMRGAGSCIGFWFFFAGWTLFAIRGLVLSDYTADAQHYGLVRLGLWMNYGSLFVHMPTPQINTFTNEWSGELIGLLYGLSAGNIQANAFGNVEVLLVLGLSCAWLAGRIGAGISLAWGVAAAAALTPATLGLATTVKGDLAACVGIVLAAGSLARAGEKFSPWGSAFMGVSTLGLAVGAKISAVIPAILFGTALLVQIRGRLKQPRTLAALLGGALVAGLFCSRYLVNLAVYKSPLMRASGESMEPGLHTFMANTALMGERLFGFFPYVSHSLSVWALAGGLGLTGFMTVASLYGWWRSPSKATALLMLSLTAIVLGLFLLPARDWSFRYYLPSVLVAVIVVLSSWAYTEWARIVALILPFAALPNVVLSLRSGEILPANWISLEPGILNSTPLERVNLMFPWALADQKRLRLSLDANPKTIVIMPGMQEFILPYMGSYAQNRLILVAGRKRFFTKVKEQHPDLVMILRSNGTLSENERARVQEAGYRWVLETAPAFIAVPN